MNEQDLMALAIVAIAVAWILFRLLRASAKSAPGCASCPVSCRQAVPGVNLPPDRSGSRVDAADKVASRV